MINRNLPPYLFFLLALKRADCREHCIYILPIFFTAQKDAEIALEVFNLKGYYKMPRFI